MACIIFLKGRKLPYRGQVPMLAVSLRIVSVGGPDVVKDVNKKSGGATRWINYIFISLGI
jgi:hypothetical protein